MSAGSETAGADPARAYAHRMGRGANEAENILHGDDEILVRRSHQNEDIQEPSTDGNADAGPGRPLYKTTIVIWSEYDPTGLELSELAEEAEEGGNYCSRFDSKYVQDPGADPDWDGTEFFDEFGG